MTDIMKLADDYARWSATSFSSDAVSETRAALQSAIEALQATQASQSMQLAHDAVTIECLNDKVLALQGENERLNNEMAAGAQNMRWMMKSHNKNYDTLTAERDALAEELAGLKSQEPVAWHTEDHLTDRSATTYDKGVALRWEGKGWPVNPLYAAPKALEPEPLIKFRHGCKWCGKAKCAAGCYGITKGTP